MLCCSCRTRDRHKSFCSLFLLELRSVSLRSRRMSRLPVPVDFHACPSAEHCHSPASPIVSVTYVGSCDDAVFSLLPHGQLRPLCTCPVPSSWSGSHRIGLVPVQSMRRVPGPLGPLAWNSSCIQTHAPFLLGQALNTYQLEPHTNELFILSWCNTVTVNIGDVNVKVLPLHYYPGFIVTHDDTPSLLVSPLPDGDYCRGQSEGDSWHV